MPVVSATLADVFNNCSKAYVVRRSSPKSSFVRKCDEATSQGYWILVLAAQELVAVVSDSGWTKQWHE